MTSPAPDSRRVDPLQACIETAAEADRWRRLYHSLHGAFVASVVANVLLLCGLLTAVVALINK